MPPSINTEPLIRIPTWRESRQEPVLFKTAIRYLALDLWEPIGWRALEEHLTQPLVRFTQDVGDFRRCTIFDTAGNG